MIVLGCDPGKAGGLVVLDEAGQIVEAVAMPVLKAAKGRAEYDLVAIRRFLTRVALDTATFELTAAKGGEMVQRLSPVVLHVTCERAQPLPPSMPGGGVAQFHRGVSRGLWEGMLAGLGIPYELVSPRSWQSAMLRDVQGSDTKQRALIAAQRLFPGHDFRATERSRKAHDGIVDAALIAEYGRRRLRAVDAA